MFILCFVFVDQPVVLKTCLTEKNMRVEIYEKVGSAGENWKVCFHISSLFVFACLFVFYIYLFLPLKKQCVSKGSSGDYSSLEDLVNIDTPIAAGVMAVKVLFCFSIFYFLFFNSRC
jgi:hypothetical protein